MPSPYAAAGTVCSIITGSWQQNLLQARRLDHHPYHYHGMGTRSFLFLSCLFCSFSSSTLCHVRILEGLPTARSSTSSPAFFFFCFLASHLSFWLAFLACFLFRTPRYDIQGKERNKERENYFDRICSHLSFGSMWCFAFDVGFLGTELAIL